MTFPSALVVWGGTAELVAGLTGQTHHFNHGTGLQSAALSFSTIRLMAWEMAASETPITALGGFVKHDVVLCQR
jgi:hypothetical protein